MTKIVDWDHHIGRRLRLRDLHIFFTVVHCGSMAKAAAQLRVSQPAVSQVVSDLEHALGVSLLDRSSRGVEPNLYGRTLLKGGAAAFDELKQTVKEIQFLADPTTGEARIGCPETVAAILPPVIERLSQTHPGVVLHVSDVVAPTLDLSHLRDRSLDIALVRTAGLPSNHHFGDDLDVEVLFNDEAVLVAGMTADGRRRKIELADLKDALWILSPADSWATMTVVEAFRAVGQEPPKINLVTFSVQLRANLAATGRYITLFPRSMMRLYAERMLLKVLPVNLPRRAWPVVAATLKNRTLNPVVQIFREQVRGAVKLLAPNDAFRS